MSGDGTCLRCESEVEPGDLRCPVCAAMRVPTQGAPEVPRVRVLRCGECNAVMRYEPRFEAAACPFCGERLGLELPKDPIEEAREFVPFTMDRRAAAAAIGAWLSRKPLFAPGDLVERARVAKTQPVLWAAWVLSGHAKVHFTADVRGAGHRAAWSPLVEQLEQDLEGLVVPATRGLTSEEAAGLAGYDLSSAAPTPPERVLLEDYGVTRSAARTTIAEAVREDAMAAVLRSSVRPLRAVKAEVALSRLRTRRVLLPAWVCAYRYDGRLYRVVLHGQDPGSVVGTMPLSWLRVSVAIAAGACAVLGALFFWLR